MDLGLNVKVLRGKVPRQVMDGTWSRCGDIPNAAPTPFGHIVHENVLALVVSWTNLIFYRMYLIGTNLFSSIMCCAWQKKEAIFCQSIDLWSSIWTLFGPSSSSYINVHYVACLWFFFPDGIRMLVDLICQCPIWIHLLLMCLSLEMLCCSRCWIIACFCLLEESIANSLFDIILWGIKALLAL